MPAGAARGLHEYSGNTPCAAESGKSITVPGNLVYHPVASDNIVVAVHATNPVRTLTRQQIKDLMTGKIRNWKQVGGPDLDATTAAPPRLVERVAAHPQRLRCSRAC